MALVSKGILIQKYQEEHAEDTENNIAGKTSAMENPLDKSDLFKRLMSAVRIGNIKVIQDCTAAGKINLNSVDEFNYSPLILASLCGHYEVVEFLLQSGAKCERDTFQGERAVYSALTDKIRNLLLKYDYSVSVDRRQPYAALLASLLNREAGVSVSDVSLPRPQGDIHLTSGKNEQNSIEAHRFILVARSPYFRRKIFLEPKGWRAKTLYLSGELVPASIEVLLRYLYLAELDENLAPEVLECVEKLSRLLDLPKLWDTVVSSLSTKEKRKKRNEEIEVAQKEFLRFWNEDLNRPTVLSKDDENEFTLDMMDERILSLHPDVILKVEQQENGTVAFYAAHKAVLQSEFINAAIRFKEDMQHLPHSLTSPTIVSMDVNTEMLEMILEWFYTDIAEIRPEMALDLLFAADMLFIERLKAKACMILVTQDTDDLLTGEGGYSIFDIARAGWLTRTSQKLDPFCAKFLANRLEQCLDTSNPVAVEFEDLVKESAARIDNRQETDTIEIIDDIRYYLDERFRMRFEDLGADVLEAEDVNDPTLPTPDAQIQATQQVSPSDIENPTDTMGPIEDYGLRTSTNEYDRLIDGIDLLLEKLRLDA